MPKIRLQQKSLLFQKKMDLYGPFFYQQKAERPPKALQILRLLNFSYVFETIHVF